MKVPDTGFGRYISQAVLDLLSYQLPNYFS